MSAADECANDAYGVTTATLKCAAEEPAGDCKIRSLDSARTRAIIGSNNAGPAGKAGSLRAARIGGRAGERALLLVARRAPKVLAARDGACSSAQDAPACPPKIALAKPRAPRCLNSPAASAAGLFALAGPRFVCPPQVRSRKTRYVCVLIAPGAAAPEASNAFPQVTAPHVTPLATRRALKRRRIAFPTRLRPAAHVTRSLPLRFALVSLRLKLC